MKQEKSLRRYRVLPIDKYKHDRRGLEDSRASNMTEAHLLPSDGAARESSSATSQGLGFFIL